MSDDDTFTPTTIILVVLQLITVAEVGIGMYMIGQAIKDRRGEFILEVFRRLRDPSLKSALALAKLRDDVPRHITSPSGTVQLKQVALINALTTTTVDNKLYLWMAEELDKLFDLADEYQGLINMDYISRGDMFAFEPYFQALIALPNNAAVSYVERTRPHPDRILQFLTATEVV